MRKNNSGSESGRCLPYTEHIAHSPNHFAKETYKRDSILQKRHLISRSLLIVATSDQMSAVYGRHRPLACLPYTSPTRMSYVYGRHLALGFWNWISLLQNIVSVIGLFGKRDLYFPYTEEISHSDIFVMGWLRLVGSLKLDISFAEYSLCYRSLWQKRPIFSRVYTEDIAHSLIWTSLLILATP